MALAPFSVIWVTRISTSSNGCTVKSLFCKKRFVLLEPTNRLVFSSKYSRTMYQLPWFIGRACSLKGTNNCFSRPQSIKAPNSVTALQCKYPKVSSCRKGSRVVAMGRSSLSRYTKTSRLSPILYSSGLYLCGNNTTLSSSSPKYNPGSVSLRIVNVLYTPNFIIDTKVKYYGLKTHFQNKEVGKIWDTDNTIGTGRYIVIRSLKTIFGPIRK